MHQRSKDDQVRCLPVEGLISVNGLAEFLGVRNDHLHEKLVKKGIKTIDIGQNTRFRLIDIADLR